MRLLFVNYEFPPVGGGAAYASLATARELAALGHRVDFLTTATSGAEHDSVIDGVHVYRVRSHRRSVHDVGLLGALGFLTFAAPRLLALTGANKYDVCHYYFGLPTGLLSRIPGPHRSVPYVISLRGSDVPGYTPQLRHYHQFMLPITRRVLRGAHRVVANSQDLRRLAAVSVPDVRIDVILNGATACATPRQNADPHVGTRILSCSRLIARKGLDTLIRAVAQCADHTLSLDIAGEGPERAALERLACAVGVADRVRFLGFRDRSGLADAYARADLFALVSHAESCSMALLEAMAAGLPIIATRAGGNVELVESDVNGLLVEPGRVDELAAALSALAADPSRRQRFGAANRLRVEQHFAWKTVAARYEAVFKEAVRNVRGPAVAGSAPRRAAPESVKR